MRKPTTHFGTVKTEIDPSAVAQLVRCMQHPSAVRGALMADHHKGYSMPIGGVVAYRDQLSPSGVGYDIGCGNCAVKTNLMIGDIKADLSMIMDEVAYRIEFGVGGSNAGKPYGDNAIFDDWSDQPHWVQQMKEKARQQLGTVGGGNHYVNIMYDERGVVWVCNHFGSRGLGHGIASGFMALGRGLPYDARVNDDMDAPPILIPAKSELGYAYDQAVGLAADYAYEGRWIVAREVLKILGAIGVDSINAHHNDYWEERVDGEWAYVVRKGATPLLPDERAYIGGSMTVGSAIVCGRREGLPHEAVLYSAPHGAGRIMSRSQAKGNRKGTRPGLVTRQMMDEAVAAAGIELRGGDLDESPFVYRNLWPVLDAHRDTLEIETWLYPAGVAMAPARTVDPYKD
jgi:tRNA-splicing ligase RtcB